MDLIAQVALAIGFFLVLKAIEYRSVPDGLYRACSLGAWVSFVVGVVLWLVA